MDVKQHKMPEGFELKFSGKRRKGSMCSTYNRLHTIKELIGEVVCPCGNANVVVPEPEE